MEAAPSQVTYAGESISTPSDVRQLPRKGVKSVSKDERSLLPYTTLASP